MDKYIIDDISTPLIIGLACFSLLWAGINAYLISRVDMKPEGLKI